MTEVIKIAYTPDPDDAFHYFALERGLLAPPAGHHFLFSHRPIQTLNEQSLAGHYDVCAISSVHYPAIAADYAILASGASVGRGYGPVLGAHASTQFSTLDGRRVAVPGTLTTGNFLLDYFYHGFERVVLPFDAIAPAIVSGEVDAGVLIHEELLNYAEQPIRRLCCLGQRWCELSGLPLPVGLNVVRRGLGQALLYELATLIHASMQLALADPTPALDFARHFGRGPESAVREDFIARFANQDTLLMPADVRAGLADLYRRGVAAGLIATPPPLDLIEPVLATPRTVAVAQ